jgi:transmembrane protein TMEM260 (protein O-mannosyltransferase)
MATATAPKPSVSPYRSAADDELDYRPSYGAAAIVALCIFALYIVTLAPTTAMWDTSEYIAAAYTLGLPHPPGNPLFVLIGRVFAVLPIAPNVAMRINVLAAVCSAGAAAMWFLITERVLVGWLPMRWQRIVGATVATIIGATAFTVWNQSVVNEKVYTVSLLGIAVISWLMIRWSDDPDGRKADRTLVLVAYLLGLGYTNHMAGMLPGLAVSVAVLVRRPRTLLRWRLLLAALAALVFGITPFATQPIRAAYFPALNEGEPTACQNGLKVSCTFSKETYDRFMYNFNRGQYGKPTLSERQAPFTGQLGMWWYYFKWQWLRDAHIDQPGLQAVLAAVFLVLGLFGGWIHYKRDRRSFWYFGTLMFSMTLLLIYYLNFKYGATQSPELGNTVDREVRDRDYFYLWSFSAWGVWAGLGLLYIWESISSLFGTEPVKLGHETVEEPKKSSWLKGSPILALALIPLLTNWSSAPRRGHTDTADFAHDMLNSVEPYGVLVVVGDNDTFPLWYAQEVEGIRKDVVVANTSLLNTDWYTRQLIRRPVYDYDPAKGPAIYRNKTWPKPAGPPLRMSPDEADSVPPYMFINKPMELKVGDLRITLDPKRLTQDANGNGVLQRADIFVLKMVADSWPGRPIYFSRTSGGYARELGFSNNVLTQGLAAKVFIPPATTTRDTVLVQGDGWFDAARTKVLWTEVFKAPKSLIRRGDWIDQPSVGIPYLFVATGLELAEVLRDRDPQTAQQVLDETRKLAQAVRLDQAVAGAEQILPSDVPIPLGDSPGAKVLPPPAAAKKSTP